MKKVGSILLASACSVMLLAGCGQNNSSAVQKQILDASTGGTLESFWSSLADNDKKSACDGFDNDFYGKLVQKDQDYLKQECTKLTQTTTTDVQPAATQTNAQPAAAAPTDSSAQPAAAAPTDSSAQPAAAAPTDSSAQPAAAAPTDSSAQPAAAAPTDSSAQPAAAAPTDSSAQPAAAAPTDSSAQPAAAAPADSSSQPAPAQSGSDDHSSNQQANTDTATNNQTTTQ